jgi:cell division protein FtsI (penicillin-binding protein 3)
MAELSKNQDSKRHIMRRLTVIQVLMVGLILFMGAKSFNIQVFKAKELASKAEQDYSKQFCIKGERGQILDRQMNKLATSIDAVSVTACPAKIENPRDVAKKIAGILDINPGELEQTLSSQRMFAWVAQKISPDQAGQIKQLKIKGIYFKTDSKRFYPNRSLAAQIIGFTGAEDTGLEGLEFKYNSTLEGSSVKIKVRQDGNGENLDIDRRKRAELRGNSIVLTIDKKIQFLSEKTLEKTVMENKAKSGIALVMRPRTGELLSVAHFPQFNPNNFRDFDQFVFRNRAVTDSFEPGSAMKRDSAQNPYSFVKTEHTGSENLPSMTPIPMTGFP